MILESVLVTCNADGSPHIAPLGLHVQQTHLVVAPFRPSRTLDNITRDGHAVVTWTTDVRLFAGPVTGRRDWPVCRLDGAPGWRLMAAHTHAALQVVDIQDDVQRPRFVCAITHEQTHRPFRGFVRAQAAVVEAAILATRLGMLPADKVERELAYLQIAIDKTAGADELAAGQGLQERCDAWRDGTPAPAP